MNTSVQALLRLARNAACEPVDVHKTVVYLTEAIQLLADRLSKTPYVDPDGDLWTRGDAPGVVRCQVLGEYQFCLSGSEVLTDQFGDWQSLCCVDAPQGVGEAIGHLWPDYSP